MPYTLLAIPSTADGPIARPAELQRLIDRGNLTGYTMAIAANKSATRDNSERDGIEDKGPCSVQLSEFACLDHL